MLVLPDDATDELALADWLELTALVSPDLNSHRNDLMSALVQASVFDESGEAAMEAKLLDTFSEIEDRERSAASGYPFQLDGGLLQAREGWHACSSYVFCLCLSYGAWKPKDSTGTYPPRMFESLCTEAAGRYVNGKSVRFGSPRVGAEIPKGFVSAVNELCVKLIREGDGFRSEERVHWTKDYGLDVVAWRDWPDSLPGKLILFGACASGQDWGDKLHDLQVQTFWDQWMMVGKLSPIIRAFFIPHRLPADRWKRTLREAGLLFDRCRIASLTPGLPSTSAHGDGLAWIDHMLRRILS